MSTTHRLDVVDEHLAVHPARVHPTAIRADAKAQLAALHAHPQAARCRSGAHIDAPTCHARPLVIHESGWPTGAPTPTPGEVELVAPPLEVWAAQHPT